MTCIKKWALKEPLVDSVESRAINSQSCAILDVNLKTAKVEDLDFSSHFELNITRDDSVHAILGW